MLQQLDAPLVVAGGISTVVLVVRAYGARHAISRRREAVHVGDTPREARVVARGTR
jgi:hypothetical protein